MVVTNPKVFELRQSAEVEAFQIVVRSDDVLQIDEIVQLRETCDFVALAEKRGQIDHVGKASDGGHVVVGANHREEVGHAAQSVGGQLVVGHVQVLHFRTRIRHRLQLVALTVENHEVGASCERERRQLVVGAAERAQRLGRARDVERGQVVFGDIERGDVFLATDGQLFIFHGDGLQLSGGGQLLG